MSACDVCNAKAGSLVRLQIGDVVSRELFQCPNCKSTICNGCVRTDRELDLEEAKQSRAKKPLRIFAGLMGGGGYDVAPQVRCPICNKALDMDASRI